jgi:phage terminase small subunit
MPPSAFRVDPHGAHAREIAQVSHRLNQTEKLFLAEYFVDRDERRAAKAIGLHPGKGKSYLRRYWVDQAIDLVDRDRRERLHVTADRIVEEYAKLGFANMGDYLDAVKGGDHYFETLDRDQRAALSEVVVEQYTDGRGDDAREVKRMKFKVHDKKAALDSMARNLGMFIDRTEVRGEMSLRLANLSRQERIDLMYTLLGRVQRFLPPGETIDMEPAESRDD